MTRDPSFTIGSVPKGYEWDFDPFLYNSPGHLSLQPEAERLSFFMVNHKKQKVTGRVSFFIREQIAYSPLNAPFGSFELSAKVSLENAFQFAAFVCDQFQAHGITKIIIKNYAQIYAPEQTTKLVTALHHHGFSLHPVINHHLVINEGSFEEKIHKMERRKLKKCEAAAYRFHEEPDSALAGIYAFIRQCRQEKGQPLNIEYDHLQKSMAVLPGKFRIFSVKKEDTVIAATITVSVNQNIIYNFLPASLSEYNHHSPMIYLLAELYGYCQSAGTGILDLGISATAEHQQFSLMRFKAHLGAETSFKFTLKKEIA